MNQPERNVRQRIDDNNNDGNEMILSPGNGKRIDSKLFMNELTDDFKCGVCYDAFHNPVICPEGHTFCEPCLKTWCAKNQECPTCRTKLDPAKFVKNRAVQSIIDSMRVYCPNRHASSDSQDLSSTVCDRITECDWQGRCGQLSAHLKDDCDFVTQRCQYNGCAFTGFKPLLRDHSSVCEMRSVQCDLCRANFTVKDKPAHNEICPKMTINCDQCKSAIERKNLKKHKRDDCLETLVSCAYGCEHKIKRKDISKHYDDNMKAHLDRLLKITSVVKPIIISSLDPIEFRWKAACQIDGHNATTEPSYSKSVSFDSQRGRKYIFCLSSEIRHVDAVTYLSLYINSGGKKTVTLKGSTYITLVHPTDASKTIVRKYITEQSIKPRSGWGYQFCRVDALAPLIDAEGKLTIRANIEVKEDLVYEV